ncbi:PREDICTED: non-ltr retroelement reverse mRNAase [Prunus dulcis]|uniref:PREDICTED: non-ltr retroelement reverse mRNAase n=1 Tax=Prunus dulcis TaxID=3755 RepID=A0A5E4FMJ4_PRUDU|nr:PREDICTED: non-ltr retroelement reverse mRNAase [Prunus dulcis]
MSDVISEYQSAFIPHHMILDNGLAAFETIHCLKRRGESGKKKGYAKARYGQGLWSGGMGIFGVDDAHDGIP